MNSKNTFLAKATAVAVVCAGAVVTFIWSPGHHPTSNLPETSRGVLTASFSDAEKKTESPRSISTPSALPDQVPSWAVRFGNEFWKTPPKPSSVAAHGTPLPKDASFNFADVVDRVSHALVADSKTGNPVASAETFS